MTEELSKGFTGIEINGVRFSNIKEMLIYMNKQRVRIINLENENAKLKKQLGMSTKVYNDNLDYSHHIEEQLTKAKEFLKWWVSHCGDHDLHYAEETERFLSEVEK